MENKFERLQREYPTSLVLQLQGGFYKSFNESASVLSDLMEYKLNETASGVKCGFPADTLDKVIKKCEMFHINYAVFNKEELEAVNEFSDNQFGFFLDLYGHKNKEINEKNKSREDQVIQSITIEEGIGINLTEAINSLKRNLEKDLLEKGFHIVSISYLQDMRSDIFSIKALVVYQ